MENIEQYETYIYKINENDIIFMTSDNWQKFLSENSGLENTNSENVIGKPLWDYICGMEAKHFYQIVLKAVRDNNREVRLLFRCDSPNTRRYLHLVIVPIGDNYIEFRSQIIKTEPRENVDILRNDIERSKDNIKMCSMCKRIETQENIWEEIEQATKTLKLFVKKYPPEISHGLCPCCYDAMMEKVK